MIHVILYQPEIPGNTGNIIRLCANTGAQLHLIEPLGFSLEDRLLRRAGLDYHEWAPVQRWPQLTDCLNALRQNHTDLNVFALTTRGQASLFDADLTGSVALLFGSETAGLPQTVRESFPAKHRLRLPMQPQSRSLNLANSVAVCIYESWRQQGFKTAQT